MFEKILLDNSDWYMSVSWFGMGSIRIFCKPRNLWRKASINQKAYLMCMVDEFHKNGQSLNADNTVINEVMEEFALAAFQPDSAGGYVFFNSYPTPESKAQGYL